eukprot:9019570-Pyramimonas_sp.AAC.1
MRSSRRRSFSRSSEVRRTSNSRFCCDTHCSLQGAAATRTGVVSGAAPGAFLPPPLGWGLLAEMLIVTAMNMLILATNMSILAANMSILAANMSILATNARRRINAAPTPHRNFPRKLRGSQRMQPEHQQACSHSVQGQ